MVGHNQAKVWPKPLLCAKTNPKIARCMPNHSQNVCYLGCVTDLRGADSAANGVDENFLSAVWTWTMVQPASVLWRTGSPYPREPSDRPHLRPPPAADQWACSGTHPAAGNTTCRDSKQSSTTMTFRSIYPSIHLQLYWWRIFVSSSAPCWARICHVDVLAVLA